MHHTIKHHQYEEVSSQQVIKTQDLDLVNEKKQNERQNSFQNITPIKLSSVSTQTSFQNGEGIQVQNVLNTDNVKTYQKDNEKKQDTKVQKDSTTIDKLKGELEEARERIKVLEEERIEADKRRSIEILSKYVPTSYPRYYALIFHINLGKH